MNDDDDGFRSFIYREPATIASFTSALTISIQSPSNPSEQIMLNSRCSETNRTLSTRDKLLSGRKRIGSESSKVNQIDLLLVMFSSGVE